MCGRRASHHHNGSIVVMTLLSNIDNSRSISIRPPVNPSDTDTMTITALETVTSLSGHKSTR